MASSRYKNDEIIRLYRNLLKNAFRFPLASRRDVVTEEVKAEFRKPSNAKLTKSDIDYKLVLGWERNETIKTYATNMYWFHSRDQVTKEMLEFSKDRDAEKTREMEKFNETSRASIKTPEVTEFKSVLYNVNPMYHHKIDKTPIVHNQDVWRARGSVGSETGGKKQKFYIKRYKPVFPCGW